jgi:uncharacterized repeat protein (TIGR03803 family)
MRAKAIVVLTFLLFSVSSGLAATYTVLYSFGGTPDGSGPYQAGVVFDQSGNLYGVTQYGGLYGEGTVFQLTPSPGGGWTENILHNFALSSDGGSPWGGLAIDGSGNLYGTALYGPGGIGCGLVFQLSPSESGWTFNVLHAFNGGKDGCVPQGDVMLGGSELYGVTAMGGGESRGTIYYMSTSGSGYYAWPFQGTVGSGPEGMGFCGLYTCGTTMIGGKEGGGTLYKWEGGYPSAMIAFKRSDKAGYLPIGNLVSSDYNVYGATSSGGVGRDGTIYQLYLNRRMAWSLRVLHSFSAFAGDGDSPWAGVILDAAGNVYGTTMYGGSDPGYGGTVFKLTPGAKNKWTETVLYSFSGGSDGGVPTGSIVFDSAGNIYGTTMSGGAYGQGVVYEVTP